MAPRKNKLVRKSAALELTLTRIFDAPRSLVFAAWTKPEHMRRWSAPHGFTIPESQGEVRPGGAWHATMRTPDGEMLKLGGVYREVIRDELLSFTHAWEGDDGKRGHETLVTVRFADYGTKTKLTFHQGPFAGAESRDGHDGGWRECFERLRTLLADLEKKSRPPRR
jgi:uncharacterized protein YndB with AHSA1/START domain